MNSADQRNYHHTCYIHFKHSIIIRGKESHQLAEANDLKNRRLREAFGLGEYDPAKQQEIDQKEREAREKEARRKKYQ